MNSYLAAIPVDSERERNSNYPWAISIMIRKITIATRAIRAVNETKSIGERPARRLTRGRQRSPSQGRWTPLPYPSDRQRIDASGCGNHTSKLQQLQ